MNQLSKLLIFMSTFLRVLLTYFAVSGLDVLDRLDRLPHDRKTLIDWIYNHQLKQSLQSNFVQLHFQATII